ncbi:MAG: TerB N-terminal domain-containing protein [Oscillospiraceae bacterium]|nr:TerB N-terminal domain-containing protein [Oscillospiraceae bacterium]
MDLWKLLGKLIGSIGEEPVPLKPKRPSSPRKPAAKRRSTGRPANRRRTGSASRSSTVYGSEAIPYSGAHLMQPVPLRIRQMRTLTAANPFARQSMEATFVRQGRYMEQFTDDCAEPVPCGRSVPMYSNLNDCELRTFFTWRTRYRQGALPEADTPYLVLYFFELLNGIGVQSPAESYALMKQLYADYAETNPELKKRFPRWIRDFAAYYGIPYPQSLDIKEAALDAVVRHSEQSAAQFTEALDRLSKYHILKSKLYADYPELTEEIVQRVYRALLTYFAENKGQSLAAMLFGGRTRTQYLMFEGAVFYEETLPPDRSVRISPRLLYECRGGTWAAEQSFSEPDSERIGSYLRTVDSLLRERLHFKAKLKAGEIPADETAVIGRVLDKYFEEQAQKNAPVITLDSAELEQIRAAAEHTADMLTLPEDAAPAEEAPADFVPAGPAEPEEDGAGDDLPDLPLSAPAMTLLCCLLTGSSCQPLTDAGHMLSVLADEINENLYDEFGDTVIETDENGMPVLVEDYIEDLKGMLEA